MSNQLIILQTLTGKEIELDIEPADKVHTMPLHQVTRSALEHLARFEKQLPSSSWSESQEKNE